MPCHGELVLATSDYLSSVDTILLLLIAFLDLQYPTAGVRVLGVAIQDALQCQWLWQVSFCCKLVTALSATNEIRATFYDRAHICSTYICMYVVQLVTAATCNITYLHEATAK